MVRKKAPYTYSLYSVSDSGQQSHILLPKRLKTRTIMSYMQLISNSSVYLIGNSNIWCVQVTCDPPLLNTILLLICWWGCEAREFKHFLFRFIPFLGDWGKLAANVCFTRVLGKSDELQTCETCSNIFICEVEILRESLTNLLNLADHLRASDASAWATAVNNVGNITA